MNVAEQEIYIQLINTILKLKIRKYCEINNLQTAEGLIPGDSNIFTYNDFKKERKKEYDMLKELAIADANRTMEMCNYI